MGATIVQNRFRRKGSGAPAAFAVNYQVPDFVGTELFPFELTQLANGWLVAVAKIGPDLAQAMKSLNAGNQRTETESSVDKYSRDMAAGGWLLTHQGVAFNVEGELHDGQHRLDAVVVADAVIETLVFFGAGGKPEMTAMDNGRGRTPWQAAQVMKLGVGKDAQAIMRAALMDSTRALILTTREFLYTARNHLSAYQWVQSNFGGVGRRLKPSGVLGAFLRAYYHCPLDQLARFIRVYSLDLPAHYGWDRNAILLNRFITGGESQSLTGSRKLADQFDMRAKTMRAIEAYFAREEISRLQLGPHHGKLYPLPAYASADLDALGAAIEGQAQAAETA